MAGPNTKTPASLAASLATSQPPPQMPLDKKDYPHVKYWHATSWANLKTNKDIDVLTTDLKPKKKSSFWYFEDVNGAPLDEEQCNAITKRAREIFTHLNASGAGATKWGDMGSASQDYYRRGMYSHFPELRLCEFDWKVNRLATETYSSWYRKRKVKWGVTTKHVGTKVDAEAHDVAGDSSAEPSGPSHLPKRPQTPLQPVSCAKKVKSSGPPQPTPPAHTLVSRRPQPTPCWKPSVPALITPAIMSIPSSSVPEPSMPISPTTIPSAPVSKPSTPEPSTPISPTTMPSVPVSEPSTPVPPLSTMPLTPPVSATSSTLTPLMLLSSVAMSSTPIPPPMLPLTPVSSTQVSSVAMRPMPSMLVSPVIPSCVAFPHCY